MSAGCFSWCRLHMPWGTKKQSLETKLPEVSAHLCCEIIHWHRCIQKRESKPAIVPARTITKNFIERKVEPDVVRWLVHVFQYLWCPYEFSNCLKFHGASRSFQQKQITLLPVWKKFLPWLNLQLQWFQLRSWKRLLKLHWGLDDWAMFVESRLWRLQDDWSDHSLDYTETWTIGEGGAS